MFRPLSDTRNKYVVEIYCAKVGIVYSSSKYSEVPDCKLRVSCWDLFCKRDRFRMLAIETEEATTFFLALFPTLILFS